MVCGLWCARDKQESRNNFTGRHGILIQHTWHPGKSWYINYLHTEVDLQRANRYTGNSRPLILRIHYNKVHLEDTRFYPHNSKRVFRLEVFVWQNS